MKDFKKQIDKLNKTLVKWGCHYQVYDYDGYTIEELLMQFFHKINEVIEMVNEYSKLVSALIEWVVEEGLKEIVNEKLEEMAQDGTLSDIINEKIFGELNSKIDNLELSFEDFKILINSQLDEFEESIQNKLDTMKEEITTDYTIADEKIIEQVEEIEKNINNTISKKISNDFERKIFDKYGLEPNGEISGPLQAFVNAVNEGIETSLIYIPQGNYSWFNEVTNVNNVHIIAHPKAHFKRTNPDMAGFIINGVHGEEYIGRTAGSNIIIDGGIWDVDTYGLVGHCCIFNFGIGRNITVKNARLQNYEGNHVFDISGCDGVTIDNCDFGPWKGDSDSYVELIQIAPHTKGGFPQFGHNKEALDLNCINVTVKNCVFDKCSCAVGNHSGVYPGYETYIDIINNVFKECTTVAIRADHWEKVNIKGNKFYKMPQAILLQGSHQILDLGREYSLSCQDVTISDNIFYECTKSDGSLIYAKGYRGASESTTYTGFVNNLIITNNVFKNIKNGRCIWVSLGKKVVISNNTASCINFARVGSTENFSITGNSIEAEGTQVIIVSLDNVPWEQTRGCSYGIISGNSIVGRLGSLVMVVRSHNIDVSSNKFVFRDTASDIKAIDMNTNCVSCSAMSNSCTCMKATDHPVYTANSSCSSVMYGMNLAFGVSGNWTVNNSTGQGGTFAPSFS